MIGARSRRWVMAAIILLLSSLAGLGDSRAALADTPGAARLKNTIIVGRVSGDPRHAYPRLESLAKYLAHRFRSLGIKKGEVIIAKNNNEMIQLLKTGKVDFLSETVMSALLFQERARAEILLHEWKKNVGWYWSVFFTHKKNEIKKLTDLRGKKIAFEDPGSTTGFLIPLAILRAAGLDMVRLHSYRNSVPPGKVGYAFAHEEFNITAWVTQKNVHAGAYSNQDWQSLERSPTSMRKNLRLLYKGQPMTRSLFLVRHGIRPKLKRAVKKILLAMDKDKIGRQILKKLSTPE